MANTIIQIKRSTSTGRPTDGSLSSAEPAYSYQSGKLWLGTPDGEGVICVGGEFLVNLANVIFSHANAAFLQANTGDSLGNYLHGLVNAAFTQANVASPAFNTANAAYDLANTKFDATGGVIDGDVSITGNLSVLGEVTSFNTTIALVEDPLLMLANGNASDVVDVGLIGQYTNANAAHIYTGVYRDAGTKEWYIFDGYDDALDVSNHIDPEGNNFTLAVLNADIRTSNLILGGANAIMWIRSAYDTANAAYNFANTAANIAIAAFAFANAEAITVRTVEYGGTGANTFANNGVIFGNGDGPLRVTAAGTEGQVLMATSQGTPIFQHLNGGEF